MPNVSGRVVFDANRSASIDFGDTGLENIPVVLQDVNTGNRLVVLTDFSGNYTFTNVPNGIYRIVEAYGTLGGIPTPGDFSGAIVGVVPIGEDPPITSAINPPPGATDIDSLSPNTLFITVAGADISNQNFLDGPVIYTDIGEILDPCTTINPTNLITAADNGTYGTEPAGSTINTAPAVDPYPGIASGFSYITPLPPATRPIDGTYTIQNISGLMAINASNTWWRIADHTAGDETGRFQAIGGSNPGAVFFQETINVMPNTNYLFSAWILNLIRRNGFAEPKLGVEILDQGGGVLYQQTLGSAIPASILAPEWKEIGTALNSQGNSQLTVRFTSEGPAATGNDYAIDDIAFREVDIPTFTPIKSINKNIADIGEIVTYTVTLENDCENDLTNVTFQDIVPNGLTFEAGTVTVNGVINPALDPNVGFSVPDIQGLNTTIITFDARVDSIPVPNPTDNTANMTYEYTPITGGIPNQFNQNTNIVSLLVNHAELNPTKNVDLFIADIGDELTYTISFANTGNVDAENVVLTDSVPSGTSYVAGSLTSNVIVTGDPTSTVNLVNPVAPGETVNISFRVRIDTLPNPNPIPNTGNLNYEYTVDPLNPQVEVNVDTNTVLTQVNNATLIPVKGVNKDYADVGEEVTYTISFTNTGNVDAENIEIIDPIPSETVYVSGSLISNVSFTGGSCK
ncbi:cell surface protein [Clostridium sp. B9]|uniref:cell surface protein n=1 Tax=Clostridium sp. B9 TaxID=3423224 RepID=UPI003D2EEFF9